MFISQYKLCIVFCEVLRDCPASIHKELRNYDQSLRQPGSVQA